MLQFIKYFPRGSRVVVVTFVWPITLKVWPSSLKVWPSILKVWSSRLCAWPSSSYALGAPGGPWGPYFRTIFTLFSPFFPPCGAPYFSFYAAALWGAPPVHFTLFMSEERSTTSQVELSSGCSLGRDTSLKGPCSAGSYQCKLRPGAPRSAFFLDFLGS